MLCNILDCPVTKLHDTKDHLCERCNCTGHGRVECPKRNYNIEFVLKFVPDEIITKIKNKESTGTIFDEMIIHGISNGYFIIGKINNGDTYVIKNDNGIYPYVIIDKAKIDSLHKKSIKYYDIYFIRYFLEDFIKNIKSL